MLRKFFDGCWGSKDRRSSRLNGSHARAAQRLPSPKQQGTHNTLPSSHSDDSYGALFQNSSNSQTSCFGPRHAVAPKTAPHKAALQDDGVSASWSMDGCSSASTTGRMEDDRSFVSRQPSSYVHHLDGTSHDSAQLRVYANPLSESSLAEMGGLTRAHPQQGEAERPPSFSPEDAQDTGGADEDPLDCALDEVIGEAHAYGHPSRWSCPPSPGLHIPTYPGTPGDHPAVGNDDQAFAASLLEHLQRLLEEVAADTAAAAAAARRIPTASPSLSVPTSPRGVPASPFQGMPASPYEAFTTQGMLTPTCGVPASPQGMVSPQAIPTSPRSSHAPQWGTTPNHTHNHSLAPPHTPLSPPHPHLTAPHPEHAHLHVLLSTPPTGACTPQPYYASVPPHGHYPAAPHLSPLALPCGSPHFTWGNHSGCVPHPFNSFAAPYPQPQPHTQSSAAMYPLHSSSEYMLHPLHSFPAPYPHPQPPPYSCSPPPSPFYSFSSPPPTSMLTAYPPAAPSAAAMPSPFPTPAAWTDAAQPQQPQHSDISAAHNLPSWTDAAQSQHSSTTAGSPLFNPSPTTPQPAHTPPMNQPLAQHHTHSEQQEESQPLTQPHTTPSDQREEQQPLPSDFPPALTPLSPTADTHSSAPWCEADTLQGFEQGKTGSSKEPVFDVGAANSVASRQSVSPRRSGGVRLQQNQHSQQQTAAGRQERGSAMRKPNSSSVGSSSVKGSGHISPTLSSLNSKLDSLSGMAGGMADKLAAHLAAARAGDLVHSQRHRPSEATTSQLRSPNQSSSTSRAHPVTPVHQPPHQPPLTSSFNITEGVAGEQRGGREQRGGSTDSGGSGKSAQTFLEVVNQHATRLHNMTDPYR